MEQIDLLRKIAANTAPKDSMSLAVKGSKTRIITNHNPPIELDSSKNYEMALVDLETYYSFPNIDATRNSLKWSPDNGTTWHEFKLPIGAYELSDIEEAIQNNVAKKGGTKKSISLQPNKVTLKAILKLTDGYQVDFDVDNSLRDALGFDAKIYDQPYHESTNLVNILNINTIHVNVDMISGSYVGGTHEPVIYSFFPNVDPGHKIVEKPQNLVYLPVHVRYIHSMTVTITNQEGKLLDLRGEQVSIRFHLREK